MSVWRRPLTGSTRLLSSSTTWRLAHRVVGIDLGTTNSAVAIVEGSEPRILENEEGARTTPSIVAFGKNEETTVGLPAKRQALVNPLNTFFATKRLIGRKFTDPEVQLDVANIPYKITPNENGDAWVETSTGKRMPPSQISALILQKMKRIAEAHFDSDIKHAVVTVPAYFNDAQRLATKSSGQMVGLEVLRVVNEPTAAALAYGMDKRQRDGVVAVFDLGGGTFDISILDIEGDVFEVRATNGNTHLGGEDFDVLLVEYILAHFRDTEGIDLLGDRNAVQRVREAAEKCKIELSHVTETEVNIPFVAGDKHIRLKITEDELDAMSMHLIEKTVDPVKKCLRDAGLKPQDIDDVILVGGMTRMPRIRKTVSELFKLQPNTTVNPDEAVALGAAIQGAVLSGQIKNVVLLDVTPLLLGIETYGGIFSPLIPRNSAVPLLKEQVFSTAVDGQTGVEVRVYQGERPLVKDNKLIGNFQLKNIPLGPKGTPQIAVLFAIDADGIINVTARDKTPYPEGLENHGKENQVSIQVSAESGLSEEEIQTMITESARNSKKDAELKGHIENATRADIICSDTDNALTQFGSLMEEADKKKIEDILTKVRSMIDDIRVHGKIHPKEEVNAAVTELQKVCLGAIQAVAFKQREQKGEEKE